MYCRYREWTILLTTGGKSGCIASTENGLFYLPLEGSMDVLPAQIMDYSTYHCREVRMHCQYREWTILLTTGGKSGWIDSTENGLFYLPLEGSQDALPVQRMNYSTYHWREVRIHCWYREWTILLTTGGKSGCIACTEDELFYFNTTGGNSGCTAGIENGLFYLPLEGSLDALLVQRMNYSTYHWREVRMHCLHR